MFVKNSDTWITGTLSKLDEKALEYDGVFARSFGYLMMIFMAVVVAAILGGEMLFEVGPNAALTIGTGINVVVLAVFASLYPGARRHDRALAQRKEYLQDSGRVHQLHSRLLAVLYEKVNHDRALLERNPAEVDVFLQSTDAQEALSHLNTNRGLSEEIKEKLQAVIDHHAQKAIDVMRQLDPEHHLIALRTKELLALQAPVQPEPLFDEEHEHRGENTM